MFNRKKLGVFLSREPGELDWSNFTKSGVHRIMLPWNPDISTDNVLRRLARMQPAYDPGDSIEVILRMYPEDVANGHVGNIQDRMFHVKSLCNLLAIQVGNEPDWPLGWGNPIDFSWGSPNWYIDYLYQELVRVVEVRNALQGHDVKILSPGWLNRPHSENSPPLPGQVAWARAAQPVYNEFDGNGVHIYEMGWANLPSPDPAKPDYYGSWIDPIRFQNQVRYWSSTWHKPIWIDEFNIDKGPNKPIPQTYRMAACMSAARTLRDDRNLGDRVEFFCPFVSNGYKDSGAFPVGMIMDEPDNYDLVAAFMREN